MTGRLGPHGDVGCIKLVRFITLSCPLLFDFSTFVLMCQNLPECVHFSPIVSSFIKLYISTFVRFCPVLSDCVRICHICSTFVQFCLISTFVWFLLWWCCKNLSRLKTTFATFFVDVTFATLTLGWVASGVDLSIVVDGYLEELLTEVTEKLFGSCRLILFGVHKYFSSFQSYFQRVRRQAV